MLCLIVVACLCVAFWILFFFSLRSLVEMVVFIWSILKCFDIVISRIFVGVRLLLAVVAVIWVVRVVRFEVRCRVRFMVVVWLIIVLGF